VRRELSRKAESRLRRNFARSALHRPTDRIYSQ
jgi:hypothetical protein